MLNVVSTSLYHAERGLKRSRNVDGLLYDPPGVFGSALLVEISVRRTHTSLEDVNDDVVQRGQGQDSTSTSFKALGRRCINSDHS